MALPLPRGQQSAAISVSTRLTTWALLLLTLRWKGLAVGPPPQLGSYSFSLQTGLDRLLVSGFP